MSEQSEKAIETEACNIYFLKIQYKKQTTFTTLHQHLYCICIPRSNPRPLPFQVQRRWWMARAVCVVCTVCMQASVCLFFFEIKQRMVGEGKKKMRSLSCFLGCAYKSVIFVSVSKHPSASTSMALSFRYLPTSHPTPQPMHRPARQTHARKASRSGATHDHDHHHHHA